MLTPPMLPEDVCAPFLPILKATTVRVRNGEIKFRRVQVSDWTSTRRHSLASAWKAFKEGADAAGDKVPEVVRGHPLGEVDRSRPRFDNEILLFTKIVARLADGCSLCDRCGAGRARTRQ